MEAKRPSREPSCLLNLRRAINTSDAWDLKAAVATITSVGLVEEACDLLRTLRREALNPARLTEVSDQLMPLAAMALKRRTARWQLDTRRLRIRLSFAKEAGVLGLDDGDLHALFLHAFRLEGLYPALDLGKRPRPLLTVGLPLPAQAMGWAESLDVVLNQEPSEAPSALLARLNLRLPVGLRLHQWQPLPSYASEMGDLAVRSHWRWEVPAAGLASVAAQVSAFLSSETWPWQRGASQAEGSLDLKVLVPHMDLEAGILTFVSTMGEHQAINPLKWLGALFDLDPKHLEGVVRTHIDLKPDRRLDQGERFEPKLKNMYEDAVVLGGGSNIVLVDEDDDEPIRLG